MPREGQFSCSTSLQGVSTEVFPHKVFFTRRKGFYQAYPPETSPPRHAAYHSIVQPYVCGGARLRRDNSPQKVSCKKTSPTPFLALCALFPPRSTCAERPRMGNG